MTDITLDKKHTNRWNLWFGMGLGFIAVAAFALRVWSKDTAYGIFVDEVMYGGLAQSVHANGLIPIDLFNQAFFLHPPLVFLVGSLVTGGFVHITQNDIVSLVDQVRWVNIVVGALTAALVGLVVRFALRSHVRQASISGLIVAVLVAVDPFVTRLNGRFMLETVTVATALIGYVILLPAVNRGRLGIWRMVASGLLLGTAVLGKDMMVVAVALPILISAIWGLGGISRWRWVSLLGIAAVPYLSYIGFVSTTQYWSKWLDDKLFGIKRALGIEQVSGFHAPGAPSLIDKIVGQLGTYWPTYIVLLLAVPAVVYLLIKGTAGERLVALFAVGPGALLAFDLVAGTLEEQFLYYLLIPATASVLVAADILIFSRPIKRTVIERLVVGLVLLGVVVTPSVLGQIQIRTNPDNAYQRAVSYINNHRTPTENVAWAEGQTRYTLAQYFYLNDMKTVGPWASPSNLALHNVRYVLTTSKEISEGYSYLDPNYLKTTLPYFAKPVFTAYSRWNGKVQVWKVFDTASK